MWLKRCSIGNRSRGCEKKEIGRKKEEGVRNINYINMQNDGFERSEIWKAAKMLAVDAYALLNGCRDYSFVDQLRRSAVSVMNNISEGFERQTFREHIHFLYIAKGSCGELRSMAHLALAVGYISEREFINMYEKSSVLSKQIYSLIKYLKSHQKA